MELKIVDIEKGKEVSLPFKGVKGKALLWSEKLMLMLVEVEAGGLVPEHSHPHEQMGLCLEGNAEFRGGGESMIVRRGMVYFFKSNEKHSVKVIGNTRGRFLEVFSPPREDYLETIR